MRYSSKKGKEPVVQVRSSSNSQILHRREDIKLPQETKINSNLLRCLYKKKKLRLLLNQTPKKTSPIKEAILNPSTSFDKSDDSPVTKEKRLIGEQPR